MERPKLRNIEAFPVEAQGRELICLRDPSGLSEEVLFLTPETFSVIALFDGRHSLLDIQETVMRRYGELLYRERLLQLVEELDQHLFLESPRFEAHKKEVEEAFKRSPVRRAAHAGRSYEADPQKLREQLQSYFTSPQGPGEAPGSSRARTLKGAIIPHIDFHRGGFCYAWAYKALLDSSCDAELFIILGTAHALMEGVFALTGKDFETPLGVVETDRAFLRLVEKRYEGDLYRGELAHRFEHSVEFQAVFLQYLFGGRPFKIAPILCGSFHELIQSGEDPSSSPEVAGFLRALEGAIEEHGRKSFLIASADLAHVGSRFGDPFPVTPALLERIAREDLAMLRYVERVNAKGFFRSVQEGKDWRRICGLSPIYTLLCLVRAEEGTLLKYGQWPDRTGTVTFASLVFS